MLDASLIHNQAAPPPVSQQHPAFGLLQHQLQRDQQQNNSSLSMINPLLYLNLGNQLVSTLNQNLNQHQISRDDIISTDRLSRILGGGTSQHGNILQPFSSTQGRNPSDTPLTNNMPPPSSLQAQQQLLQILQHQHGLQQQIPQENQGQYSSSAQVGNPSPNTEGRVLTASGTSAFKVESQGGPKDGSVTKKPVEAPRNRPERLPCRARGMPEEHDYNVSPDLISRFLKLPLSTFPFKVPTFFPKFFYFYSLPTLSSSQRLDMVKSCFVHFRNAEMMA
jgi:hypothetical protein